MEWLIGAGLHPRANATTLKVAEDLSARMDYDTGHARYCMLETAARLGVNKATVKRHVKYLRELGALAWVQHGTRANIRRALGLGGYAATATVYAAVIPPCYDHAMGRTIVGSGYNARVIVDQRGQAPAQKAAVETSPDTACPVDNPPVDNSGTEGLAPPSLTLVKEESQVQMVGGFNYTPRKSASRQKPEIPHQTSSKNGRRRTAADVQQAMTVVRLVRALVNWTQRISLRRLEYVLRPLTDRGLDAFHIADELHGMCSGMRWRPKQPDRFILTRLAADAQRQTELAAAVPAQANSDWQAWRAQQHSLAALFAEPERTDADRKAARMDWNIWPDVAAHLEEDPDDANDLYGPALCKFAISQQARLENSYA